MILSSSVTTRSEKKVKEDHRMANMGKPDDNTGGACADPLLYLSVIRSL